jgi:hypothetical protein
MKPSTTQLSLNDVCYKQIFENFHYGIFGDFQLVIDKSTGYFNATKLCIMADKLFFNWKKLSRTVRLISHLQDESDVELIYEVRKGDNNNVITGQITGQYVHKDLILDIASWISPKFYHRCNNIVVDYFTTEYKSLGEAEKMKMIKELELKMKDMEIETETVIAEKNDKIDDLMKMLKTTEEARKADAKAAEEARKADALRSEMLLKAAEEARKADALKAEEARRADALKAEEARKADARRAEDMLRRMGINITDLKYQNEELLEEVTVVQHKLGIAVEDRAPLPSENKKKERFALLKRNDDAFPYYAIRGQNYYVETVLKDQLKWWQSDAKVVLDLQCHPNSKTLFVRVKDRLKKKPNVEINGCKISISGSSVSEDELLEMIREVNDEKLNVL